MPTRHDRAIEQANEMIRPLAQYHASFCQQLSMGGCAGRKSALVGERRRSRAGGRKGAGLVHDTELLRVTLDPASHDRRIVVGVSVRTPGYSRPLPRCIEEHDEFAGLISRRIKILVAVRGELAID